MQLQLSFAVLLAGLLFGVPQDTDARPTSKRMVTLPLKRLEQSRSVHPQIYLQQHINRGQRRLARMTGREEPSEHALRANLERRVLAIEGPEGLEKRYNRVGVPGKAKAAASTKSKGNQGPVNEAATAGGGVTANKGKGKGKDAGKAGGVAAGAAAGTAAAATANTADNGPGVSPDDVAAIENPSVTQANTPTDSDSLGLNIEGDDVGYLATVQMGTPPQDFLLLMDSGSADLWVGAENCQSEDGGGCGNHQFLGSKSSSTFVDTEKPFEVTYGTGNVKGDIITDNLVVSGLALDAHTFGVATQESVDFSSDAIPFDGLMGLAQSTLSEQQTLTPVESLAKAGLISEAITSYKLSRLADEKNDGEITFGGLDASKFDAATLVALPNVNTGGFWEGAMDAVSVSGTDAGLQGRTAILDTGTTLIIAPPADAAAVHQLISGAKADGQGGFTVPCTTTASVTLTFGGQAFAIDPRDLAFQPVNVNDPTGECTSGISSGQIGGATEWLVGDVFLKNAYFSTDVGKNTVSLAKLV